MKNILNTKHKAFSELSIDSLFHGSTITTQELDALPQWYYDNGKYEVKSARREVDNAEPVWYVTGKNQDGSFITVRTFNEYKMTDKQLDIYAIAKQVWRKRTLVKELNKKEDIK